MISRCWIKTKLITIYLRIKGLSTYCKCPLAAEHNYRFNMQCKLSADWLPNLNFKGFTIKKQYTCIDLHCSISSLLLPRWFTIACQHVFILLPLSPQQFGIFAAGLEGLLGEDVEAGQEEVEPTAGIALNLNDVSLRPGTGRIYYKIIRDRPIGISYYTI